MKILKFIYISLAVMLDLAFAQPNLSWYKLYDYANHQDVPYGITTDSSKNTYIVGATEVSNNPQTNFDALVLKYDSLGNLLWARRHWLLTNGYYDAFFNQIVCDSGKLLVTGNMQFGGTNRLISIMYGSTGDTIWINTYQQSGYLPGEFNTTRRIFNDNNMNYLIVDYVVNGEDIKLLLVKYDRNGQNENIYYSDLPAVSYPSDIQIVKNDSIYIFTSYTKEVATNHYLPAIAKFNDKGINVWETVLLDTNVTLQSSKIVIDNSQNVYSIVNFGYYGNTVTYLIKLDPDGNILWKTYYEVSSEEEIRPIQLIQKADGSIYIIGQYRNWQGGNNQYGFFFLKYDESGNLLEFQKEISNMIIDWIPAVRISKNQNMYILFSSRSPVNSNYDFHLIKYNYEDTLEYELIYDYQNWGSRSEEAFDFSLIDEDDFVITGRGGPEIQAYSVVTARFGTNIASVKSTGIVSDYFLYQNYPNPFNPSTTIRYEIPEGSFVTLKIFDILGNEIAILVNEEKPAGSYEVEFNIHSDEGQNLVSGVYFYQLRILGPEINSGQGIIQTKKMVLMK